MVINKNLPGQLWVLQESCFSLEPKQDPPLLPDKVLCLIDFFVPPPQLLEHGPLDDQLDH